MCCPGKQGPFRSCGCRPAESGGGPRLDKAVDIHKGAALRYVGIGDRLFGREDRAHTGVPTLEDRRPLVLRAAGDGGGHRLLVRRPPVPVPLRSHRFGIQSESVEQFGIELGLDGGHAQVTAVGRAIDTVEVGGAVEKLALSVPTVRGRLPAMNGAMTRAEPSTMAASITWPVPLARAS